MLAYYFLVERTCENKNENENVINLNHEKLIRRLRARDKRQIVT